MIEQVEQFSGTYIEVQESLGYYRLEGWQVRFSSVFVRLVSTCTTKYLSSCYIGCLYIHR